MREMKKRAEDVQYGVNGIEDTFAKNVNGGNDAVVSLHTWESDKSSKSQTSKMDVKFPMASASGEHIRKPDWRK